MKKACLQRVVVEGHQQTSNQANPLLTSSQEGFQMKKACLQRVVVERHQHAGATLHHAVGEHCTAWT